MGGTSVDMRAAALDFGRSRVSRYIQLATLFRNWIASGQWPVGSRIPNVDELARQYSVARGTIREALGLLEQEGLLQRFRAKGTFVRNSPAAQATHNLEIDWQALISAHEGAEITVLESQVTDTLPAACAQQGKPAPKYQMMRRLHRRGGRPYLLGRVYLDYEIFRKGPPAQFRRQPTLPVLQKVAGSRIATARQVLTIGMADIAVAALLQIPLNAPIAQVQRIALDRKGRILYFGEGIYRGDAIQLKIELR
jgi:GntR family transcriptional regulator